MGDPVLRLFGPVRIESGKFRSKKTVALLGYLVAMGRPVSRERLAELLWGELPQGAARQELRRALHNLSTLLPGTFQADWTTLYFAPSSVVAVDLLRFRELAAKDDRGSLQEAAELYRGDFLEGLYADDAPEFEIWLAGERERWRQKAYEMLEQLVVRCQAAGDYSDALRYARRLVTLDPWREEGHRQLMLLLARGGRFTAALKQYVTCRRLLREELDVAPSLETTRLHERIKRALAMPQSRLPMPATPFVGREEELAALHGYLANPACRLLTLVGVGGIGKSRLALEAAARHAAAGEVRFFLHGVAFVPLVGVDAPDLTTAIGTALGLAFAGEEPPERQLLRYLVDLELLLMLDNYEHLLPETKLLEAILREAPDLKLLVTSRERLGLQEEWLFVTEGLSYPLAGSDSRPPSEYDAVRLFTRQASRVRRDFSLEGTGETVGEITRLAQGMPLALELAAAWLASLTTADVAAEVGRGLDFLAANERNLPARHRSLRAVFRSSWARLSPAEARVLAALSVFRGGFTREAAAEVAGATRPILAALTDRSLIRLAADGRFGMHELLRQYAAEQLATHPGGVGAVHERYGAYYGEFLAAREQRLLETDQERALHEIDQEMDNVRLVWRWLVEHQKVDILDKALWTLAVFYQFRGWSIEGLDLAERTLAGLTSLDDHEPQKARLRARLYLFQASFLYYLGRLTATRSLLEAHLGQLRSWGTSLDLCWALFMLGQTLGELEEPGRLARLREALELARTLGLRALEGIIAMRLANFLFLEGERAAEDEGEQLLSQALAVAQHIDNPLLLFSAFLVDGRVAEFRRQYHQSTQAYERALAAVRRLNYPWMMGLVLNDLGHVTYLQGHFAHARPYYEKSGFFIHRMGSKKLEAALLNSLGELARAEGDSEEAAGHYRAGRAIYEELGVAFETIRITCNLGHALLGQAQVSRAASCFREVLAELGRSHLLLSGMALAGAVGVLAARDQAEQAARLGGAADAQLSAMPLKLEPADRQAWERIQAEVRAKLDEETLAAAWAEGQGMPADEAVELALSLL